MQNESGSGGGTPFAKGAALVIRAMLQSPHFLNDELLNTLISAAIQDTGATVEDFGEGAGGQLDAIRA